MKDICIDHIKDVIEKYKILASQLIEDLDLYPFIINCFRWKLENPTANFRYIDFSKWYI